MKKESQKDKVLIQLLNRGEVTRNWCLQKYISRLSAIIYQLKKEGWIFKEFYRAENGGKNYVYEVMRKPGEQIAKMF